MGLRRGNGKAAYYLQLAGTDAKFRLTGSKMIRIICDVFSKHSQVLYVFQGTEELEEGTMN